MVGDVIEARFMPVIIVELTHIGQRNLHNEIRRIRPSAERRSGETAQSIRGRTQRGRISFSLLSFMGKAVPFGAAFLLYIRTGGIKKADIYYTDYQTI